MQIFALQNSFFGAFNPENSHLGAFHSTKGRKRSFLFLIFEDGAFFNEQKSAISVFSSQLFYFK